VGGDRARDVHRAEQVDLELTPHRGIGEGLEETQFGIAGIVDQHVDRTEPLGGLGGDRVRGFGVRDIEREGVQAIVFAPAGIAHRVGGTTVSPASSAARVISRPSPRLAPVTSQTLPIACSSFLHCY
jgi:hypothetical protein